MKGLFAKLRFGDPVGFTLVEIAIVVLVIGVMVSIAMPTYSIVRNEVRNKQANHDLDILFAAIEQLVWDTGKYPRNVSKATIKTTSNPLESSDLSLQSAGLLSCDTNYLNWNGPYMGTIPRDPWNSRYICDPDYYFNYDASDPTGRAVVIHSPGPNRSGVNVYDSDNIVQVFQYTR